MKRYRLFILMFGLSLCVNADELDPVAVQLDSEIAQLTASYEKSVKSKKAKAIKAYERLKEQAIRRSDLATANKIEVKIKALRGEKALVAESWDADSIEGGWVMESANRSFTYTVNIDHIDGKLYRLSREGGVALNLCGDYILDGKRNFVKVKKEGDNYWDLSWRYFNGKFTVKKGQYKGWELTREL